MIILLEESHPFVFVTLLGSPPLMGIIGNPKEIHGTSIKKTGCSIGDKGMNKGIQ